MGFNSGFKGLKSEHTQHMFHAPHPCHLPSSQVT